MESISLPMILTDLSLEDAFDAMKSARRSGIVRKKSANEFRLYTAADVVVNIARGEKQHLDQLPGEKLELPDITAVAKETPEPYIDTERLATSLSSGKGYGLLAAGRYEAQLRAILLVTTAELLAKLEPEPEDCYDANDHPGPRGGTCPKDGLKFQCR
jgi:hypothetical protein